MRTSHLFSLFFFHVIYFLSIGNVYSQFPPPPNGNYAVDALGSYYVPHQMIVQYNSDWTFALIDSLHLKYNVVSYETCGCDYENRLELWTLADTMSIDSVQETIIEEKGASKEAEAMIENTGFNFYTATESTAGCYPIPDSLLSLPMYTSQYQDPDWLVVAILDTGVDYDHPDLQSYIWYNTEESFGQNGMDTDSNCFTDDIIGYNFVADHNNPKDDNGHGTHIAGIMASRINAIDPTGAPNIRLMNIKTHDNYGYANLFDAACGMYYSIENGAKIINASWGYYGAKSDVLYQVINVANDQDVLIVCSAGNYGLDVEGTVRHYPSSFDNGNLVVVTATDDSNYFLETSNYSNTHVDLAAKGQNVLSTLPEEGYYPKTGTSMSTAIVTIKIAERFRINPIATANTMQSWIFNEVIAEPTLIPLTSEGGYVDMPIINVFSDYVTMDARIQLQGNYDPVTGLMRDDLRVAGWIPILNPYNCFEYIGDPKVLDDYGANSIVDWVMVELRDKTNPNIVVTQRACLLKRTGEIVDIDRVSPPKFYTPSNEYFVVVRHRNHLPIISNYSVLLQQQPTTLSFQYNPFLTNTINQIPLGGQQGGYGLIAGDANEDCYVDSGDRSLIWNNRNDTGYLLEDLNMDGVVDSGDRSFTWNNRNRGTSAPCWE